MRLVIRNRYGSAAGGLHRYNGSGMFSSIGRKLFSSGLKKVINVATKANIPQKIVNTVVDGAQSVGENLGKTAGKKLGKVAGKIAKRKLTPAPPPPPSPQQVTTIEPPSKQTKIDVNHLIDGSGVGSGFGLSE